MKGRRTKKRGISAVVGSLIFLQILLVSVVLVIYVTNHQTTATQRSIASLQKSTHGVIYEKYENGQTYLIVTQPINITHIIYPNGTVKSTSITVASQINVNEILDGQPWAVITTSQGEWFNVTPITLPQITDPPQFSYVCGQPAGSANPGPNPDWNILEGLEGVYEHCSHSTQRTIVIYPNDTATKSNISVSVAYNITSNNPVVVWNPYWVWAVEQLESNKYQFPFNGGNQTGGYFPFSATMFDPWDQYYYYYLLITSSLLPTLNMPLYYSAKYYLAPMCWTPNPGDVHKEPLIVNVTYADTTYNTHSYETVTVGNVLIINNPPGGIEFSYDYINDSIAAYVPVSTNTNIYYAYYYLDNFEIYNLSALVPKQINITQFRPVSCTAGLPGKVKILSVKASPGVPTQFLYVWTDETNNTTYLHIVFGYNATTVSYNATWVHNLVLSASSNKYVPANTCDAALTSPLLPAPPTPEMTQAYAMMGPTSPVKYTVSEYPNGSFNYTPFYLNFPATSYTGFPSYFGQYSLPAYGINIGSCTSLDYATEWFGGYNYGSYTYNGAFTGYTYGYIADTVYGNFSEPVTNFGLLIEPNLYMVDIGHWESIYWQAYYGVPTGYWQLVTYLPIYVVVPGGTYVENVSEGAFIS